MEKQKLCKKCKGYPRFCPPQYTCIPYKSSDSAFRSRRFVNWDALPGRG